MTEPTTRAGDRCVSVAGGRRRRIRCGKTDQAGQGTEIGLPYGKYAETCPPRAFEAWQTVAQRQAGPLFRPISTGDRIGDTVLHVASVQSPNRPLCLDYPSSASSDFASSKSLVSKPSVNQP